MHADQTIQSAINSFIFRSEHRSFFVNVHLLNSAQDAVSISFDSNMNSGIKGLPPISHADVTAGLTGPRRKELIVPGERFDRAEKIGDITIATVSHDVADIAPSSVRR